MSQTPLSTHHYLTRGGSTGGARGRSPSVLSDRTKCILSINDSFHQNADRSQVWRKRGDTFSTHRKYPLGNPQYLTFAVFKWLKHTEMMVWECKGTVKGLSQCYWCTNITGEPYTLYATANTDDKVGCFSQILSLLRHFQLVDRKCTYHLACNQQVTTKIEVR